VNELAEAQRRTEERLNGLAEEVRQLAEAQRRTEERVNELAKAQRRTEERVNELAQAQKRTEETLNALAKVQKQMIEDIAHLKGRLLEFTYHQRVGAYFGPLLKRVQALSPIEIEEQVETRLSPEEFNDLLQLDLLVRGWPRYIEGVPKVWLAVEVSSVIDKKDVERARRRAGYLRQAGLIAIPTVAGEQATVGAKREVRKHKVLMLLDGGAILWEEALREAIPELAQKE